MEEIKNVRIQNNYILIYSKSYFFSSFPLTFLHYFLAKQTLFDPVCYSTRPSKLFFFFSTYLNFPCFLPKPPIIKSVRAFNFYDYPFNPNLELRHRMQASQHTGREKIKRSQKRHSIFARQERVLENLYLLVTIAFQIHIRSGKFRT